MPLPVRQVTVTVNLKAVVIGAPGRARDWPVRVEVPVTLVARGLPVPLSSEHSAADHVLVLGPAGDVVR